MRGAVILLDSKMLVGYPYHAGFILSERASTVSTGIVSVSAACSTGSSYLQPRCLNISLFFQSDCFTSKLLISLPLLLSPSSLPPHTQRQTDRHTHTHTHTQTGGSGYGWSALNQHYSALQMFLIYNSWCPVLASDCAELRLSCKHQCATVCGRWRGHRQDDSIKTQRHTGWSHGGMPSNNWLTENRSSC